MAKGSSKKNGSRDDRKVAVAVPVSTTTTAHAVESDDTVTAPVARSARPAPVGTELLERGAELAAASLRAVQAVLPGGRTPLVLLGAGLLVAGAVELPVVVGAALVYEALRRWQPGGDGPARP